MEPLEHRGQDRADGTGGSCTEKIIRRVGPWKGFQQKEWRGLYFKQGVYLKGKVCTAKKKGNKIYDMCQQLCMLFSYTHFMETEAQRISLRIQGAQEISAWTSTQLQTFLAWMAVIFTFSCASPTEESGKTWLSRSNICKSGVGEKVRKKTQNPKPKNIFWGRKGCLQYFTELEFLVPQLP